MNCSKGSGKQNGRRPETDACRERELSVAAQEEFFEEADQHKEHSPECSKLHDSGAVQRQGAEVKDMRTAQANHQAGERNDAPQAANPEQFS